jgi:hypothetical protein
MFNYNQRISKFVIIHAVSGIGIFLYEELTHGTLHPKLNEAFVVILGNLRVSIFINKIRWKGCNKLFF